LLVAKPPSCIVTPVAIFNLLTPKTIKI